MCFTSLLTWKDFLKGQLGELEVIVLTNDINSDNISELRELSSVSTPILAGVSPTKQMPEALVEQTMPMGS